MYRKLEKHKETIQIVFLHSNTTVQVHNICLHQPSTKTQFTRIPNCGDNVRFVNM